MTTPLATSRRALMRAALTGCATLALPRLSLARSDLTEAPGRIATLALFGPPAGPSVTLAHAVARNAFADIADAATMTAWRSPDELRAGLSSGRIGLSVVPVQAAANLYNRGFPIRLANVMTNGLLYIVADGGGIATIPDLKGLRLAVPFRGDTPEILLRRLLEHAGLNPETDLQITWAGTPIEAMQMLLAGRVDAALTAEPAASAAVIQGRQAGKNITRAIDLQVEWGRMTGAAPVLPQAGLAVTDTFLSAHGAALPALRHTTAAAHLPAPPGLARLARARALGTQGYAARAGPARAPRRAARLRLATSPAQCHAA